MAGDSIVDTSRVRPHRISHLLAEQLAGEGLVVMVANARLDAEGRMEQIKPLQFDGGVVAALLEGVTGAVAASPITFAPWREFVVKGTGYQLRTVYGAGEQYLRVMGLELVAGTPFSAAQVAAGTRETLISATLAELLFGSPLAALGQAIQAPADVVIEMEGEGMAADLDYLRRLLSPVFTVRGVFADPGEVGRRAYGSADIIVPAGAVLPGKDAAYVEGLVMSRIALRVAGSRFPTIESEVHAALARHYGDGVAVAVWEGQPTGEIAALEEMRATLATFSVVVNLLGFVLLVTGRVGILSIMLVEVLGRSREIAVARALGASTGAITREFFHPLADRRRSEPAPRRPPHRFGGADLPRRDAGGSRRQRDHPPPRGAGCRRGAGRGRPVRRAAPARGPTPPPSPKQCVSNVQVPPSTQAHAFVQPALDPIE